VVHHTVDPDGAVREIARTLKPGGRLLIYVYEAFDRRSIALAGSTRSRECGADKPISAMSPAAIRRVCAVLAPFVYITCTIPSRHFAWAKSFPYPRRKTAI
jgi:SAM-dependent methyltransferase